MAHWVCSLVLLDVWGHQMTTKVTKESLAENIGRLESYGDLSINEEYQLKAYRLRLALLEKENGE